MSNHIDVRKIVFALIIVFGVMMCVRIYGFNERVIAAVSIVFDIFLTVVVAAVVWIVYGYVLRYLLRWLDETVDDGTKSEVYPLLSTMGNIIIVAAAVMIILTVLGVQSTVAAIVAAIAGLAVSFGAQNTLSQFFSGMNLLMTRPFKVDDIIELNGNGKRLKVVKIGIMNTVFREWDYDHTYSVPNNVVASSTIVNVTSDRKSYIMIMYVEFVYTLDFQRIRELILEALKECEHVLQDSGKEPSVEVENFNTNFATVKITMHIDDYMDHGKINSITREAIIKKMADNGVPLMRPTTQNVFIKSS